MTKLPSHQGMLQFRIHLSDAWKWEHVQYMRESKVIVPYL